MIGLLMDVIYVLSEIKKLTIVVLLSPFSIVASGLLFLSVGTAP